MPSGEDQTRGFPRWLPEVTSVPLDTQESLCLPSQSSAPFTQPHHTCWMPGPQFRGEPKIKGQWAQSEEKTAPLGLSPERAVGKERPEGCTGHWSAQVCAQVTPAEQRPPHLPCWCLRQGTLPRVYRMVRAAGYVPQAGKTNPQR